MTTPQLPNHFFEQIAAGQTLGVAVSGGSDSMGLLHLLLQAGASVTVATVNHHLREEACDEAEAVAQFCARHGVEHDVLDWRWSGTGNLQSEARSGRYDLLAHWAAQNDIAHIALGHTADDNIETFVMGLSRGAGLDGLSGMRHKFTRHGVTFHRPLLRARREQIRDMLRGANVTWSDDPGNDNPNYQRVQVRQSMAAFAAAGVDPEMILTSVGHLHSARHDFEIDLTEKLAGRFRLDHGDLCFDLHWLENLPQGALRRVLNAALRFISGQDYPPRAEKLNRFMAGLRRKSVVHGCVLTVKDEGLRIAREHAAVALLRVPSEAKWDRRWQVVGKHGKTTEIRALGEDGIAQCPNGWRELNLPRSTVLSSPSVWDGAKLLSAPLAGWGNGWGLSLCQSENDFSESILSH